MLRKYFLTFHVFTQNANHSDTEKFNATLATRLIRCQYLPFSIDINRAFLRRWMTMIFYADNWAPKYLISLYFVSTIIKFTHTHFLRRRVSFSLEQSACGKIKAFSTVGFLKLVFRHFCDITPAERKVLGSIPRVGSVCWDLICAPARLIAKG